MPKHGSQVQVGPYKALHCNDFSLVKSVKMPQKQFRPADAISVGQFFKNISKISVISLQCISLMVVSSLVRYLTQKNFVFPFCNATFFNNAY